MTTMTTPNKKTTMKYNKTKERPSKMNPWNTKERPKRMDHTTYDSVKDAPTISNSRTQWTNPTAASHISHRGRERN